MTSREASPDKRRCNMWLPARLVADTRKAIVSSGVSLSAHVATLLAEDLRRRRLEEQAAQAGKAA